VDTSDPTNDAGIIINNCKKQEDIAVQRLPLSNEIFVELLNMADNSKSINSEQSALADVVCIARMLGPRVSEYAQTSPNKVDYHTYPNGKEVIKAFTADDFIFFDRAGHRIFELSLESMSSVKKLQVTWKIQKNRQNGQSITLSSDDEHPQICPVRAAIRLVLRARRLGQPDNLPVACHSTRKSKRVYLTGSRIAFLLRAAAKKVFPTMSKKQLNRYSAHSLRVWACVLLDEAGMSPEFIKSRLRWMGNSFRMYLRDTAIIQDKHRDVLRAASQEILDLLDEGVNQLDITLANMTTVDAVHEHEMGDFTDPNDED
jgi:hypothetical protein